VPKDVIHASTLAFSLTSVAAAIPALTDAAAPLNAFATVSIFATPATAVVMCSLPNFSAAFTPTAPAIITFVTCT